MRIELQGMEKEFYTLRGRVAAVSGIDLTIEEGEFFVLLGPSGSGKSTLLNLIAGLERPTGGELRFGERTVAAPKRKVFVPPRQRGVAMVFQSYALYPHLDVFANIAFPLRIAKADKAEIRRAVEGAAESLDIAELLKTRPGELSGGQRQRVAIARAIVRRPQVLLLDEPLSNLDMQLRTSTRAELKRLQREFALTTVYVTHDQTEAMTLGDRIAVLRKGRIEQVGSAGELYRHPANAFIGGFVGVPPMNLLSGRVQRREGQAFLAVGDQAIFLPPPVAQKASGAQRWGIRPEHIEVEEGEGNDSGTVEGAVETVEPMGRETLLHVRVGGELVRVLTGERGRPPESEVRLRIDPDRLHFFPSAENP